MIPKTVTRIRDHTADEVNERIRRQTEENISMCSNAGPEVLPSGNHNDRVEIDRLLQIVQR